MILNSGERIDFVNDSLKLIQNEEGLTFGTDALLLAAYIKGKYDSGAELGGGSGIISMLLLTRNKIKKINCLEIQEDYANLIKRNAELNSLEERLIPLNSDLREYICKTPHDIVFTNPPYMKINNGLQNRSDKKNIARHEVHGSIDDFCKYGSNMLKFGGAFYVVYRTDRIIDLLFSMRTHNLEPKRMTFIHADKDSTPSMVLIEAKKGGKCSIKITMPLLIYKDKNHKEYTDDMNYIMNFGSFPEKFTK